MKAPLCLYVYMCPLWRPIMFIYMGPLCIWVWFFINKNMIKIEK